MKICHENSRNLPILCERDLRYFHARWATLFRLGVGAPETGDVILSEIPPLAEVFAALDAAQLPDDFLGEADRDRRPAQQRPALDELFANDSPEGSNEQ